jgi:RAT1-interacting protein
MERCYDKVSNSGFLKNICLICWRILTAPYEERDGWELNVMNVNGTLYLEEYVSDARLLEK